MLRPEHVRHVNDCAEFGAEGWTHVRDISTEAISVDLYELFGVGFRGVVWVRSNVAAWFKFGSDSSTHALVDRTARTGLRQGFPLTATEKAKRWIKSDADRHMSVQADDTAGYVAITRAGTAG